MKLNRRNVLVAATAFAAGSGPLSSQTAHAEESTPNTDEAFSDDTRVAAIVTDCAAACHECLNACTARLISGTGGLVGFMAVVRDCSDICAVTATLLARKGPMAPALRQACADACSRMIAASRDFSEINEVQQCSITAARCAAACHRSIA